MTVYAFALMSSPDVHNVLVTAKGSMMTLIIAVKCRTILAAMPNDPSGWNNLGTAFVLSTSCLLLAIGETHPTQYRGLSMTASL